jgi:membrane protein YqaA with SNARE-associated domain
MFQKLYDRTLALSQSKHATPALALVAFTESAFFPIPPDVMLLPMALANPRKAWFYAALCSVMSVLGGILGYAIGYFLFDSIGQWLFQLYGLTEKASHFQESYQHYGAWIILLKGVTPIPYKLVTITSGFAHYSFWAFVGLSIITRGARFFILIALLNRFGAPMRAVLDKHGGAVMAGLLGIVVLGFVALKFLV